MTQTNSENYLAENLKGSLDLPASDHDTTDDILLISGWVFSSTMPIWRLTFSIDGGKAEELPYPLFRHDVGAAYPNIPNASTSGFAYRYPLKPNFVGTVNLKIWITYHDNSEVCAFDRTVEVKPISPVSQLLTKLQSAGSKVVEKTSKFALFAPRAAKKVYKIWRQGGISAVNIKVREYIASRSLNDYLWIDNRYNFNHYVAPILREKIQKLSAQPKISIIIPTYNPPKAWLQAAIESVQKQIYPNWELCIADDASPESYVKPLLQKLAAKDPRIKLHFCTTNGGTAAASNAALQLVTGDFVMLMDHDDLITEEALFRVAESILEDAPDMIYSDEGMTTPEGRMITFAFRPMFSLEYLRSHPYIVHFVGFKTELLKQVGGFDSSLKISQDYDLILRIVEQAKTIVHIPQILYLWRIHQTSSGHQKQTEVMNASKQILQRHLDRCQLPGKVEDGMSFNYFQVRYALQPDQKVAIIIPTKNHGELVRQCIDSIEATVKDIPYEIIIVDHASDDLRSIYYFKSLEGRHRVMRYEGSFNFSAINNWAVKQLNPKKYSHYLFCNNDIEAIEPGWLERMVELAQHPDIGAVGAKLLYPDRRVIQHAGVGVGLNGIAEHYGKFMANQLMDAKFTDGYMGALYVNKEMSAVTAACLLMRRDAFEEVQGFDEKLAVGFGDVDLCLRSRAAGYRVVFCSQATLIHHESYSRGKTTGIDPHPEDSRLFLDRWLSMIKGGDPYYNPNLSSVSTYWDFLKPMPVMVEVPRRIYQHSQKS